jgi:hypothetical protein
MKQFKEYITDGIVRVQHKDTARSNSLLIEAKKRRIFLLKIIDKIPIDDENANYIVETSYDIIMELIRSRMLTDGYIASGSYAHEAEIA